MSVQFGRWNFDGVPLDADYLDKVSSDPRSLWTRRSRLLFKGRRRISSIMLSIPRKNPAAKPSRMSPNRAQLLPGTAASTIARNLSLTSRDDYDSFVPRMFRSLRQSTNGWGLDCFAELIGDWALSIWNPRTALCIWRKTRSAPAISTIRFDNEQVTWCTVLDPLVLFAGKQFQLDEEYIAGWLSFFPAPHLTPYVGIHSVPPSSFVSLKSANHTVIKYWDFDPENNSLPQRCGI